MSSAARRGAGAGEVGEAPETRKPFRFIPNAALPTVSPSLPFRSLSHHSSTTSQLQALSATPGPDPEQHWPLLTPRRVCLPLGSHTGHQEPLGLRGSPGGNCSLGLRVVVG